MKNRDLFFLKISLRKTSEFLQIKYRKITYDIYINRIESYLFNRANFMKKLFSRSKSYLRQFKSALKIFNIFHNTNTSVFKKTFQIIFIKAYKVNRCIVINTFNRANEYIVFYKGNIQAIFESLYDACKYAHLFPGKIQRIKLNISKIKTGNYILKSI